MRTKFIIRDARYLVTSLKSLFICLICLPFTLPIMNTFAGIAAPSIMCYFGIYGLIAYSERSKMELMDAALPVTRKEMCEARYIESIIFIIWTLVLAYMGMLLCTLTCPAKVAIDIQGKEGITVVCMMLAMALVYTGIILPCIFKFGTMKARYILVAAYLILFMAATSMPKGVVQVLFSKLENRRAGNLLMMSASLLIFYLSYLISLRIWQHKDFKG